MTREGPGKPGPYFTKKGGCMKNFIAEKIRITKQAFFCYDCQAWFCRCGYTTNFVTGNDGIFMHIYIGHHDLPTIVWDNKNRFFYSSGILTAIEKTEDVEEKHTHDFD